jgi:threonine/homoserine/homoserine lactone efflux protein
LFLSGFFLSVLAWAMALPTAIAVAHGMLQGRGQAWVSSTCGLVLIGFGCMLGRALLPA